MNSGEHEKRRQVVERMERWGADDLIVYDVLGQLDRFSCIYAAFLYHQPSNEPDVLEWIDRKTNRLIIVSRSELTRALNGYIEVFPDESIDTSDLRVHGGITFRGSRPESLFGFETEFVGFDTAHAQDLQIDFRLDSDPSIHMRVKRSLSYVVREALRVAEEI